MNCLKLKGATGERLVPFGKPYSKAPDETQVGGIFDCDGKITKVAMPNRANLKAELDAEIGPGVGDWIKVLAAPVAKLVGREGCSPCEAKRLVINSYAKLKAKHGRIEAAFLMKRLWDMSAKGEPEQALRQLKEALDD